MYTFFCQFASGFQDFQAYFGGKSVTSEAGTSRNGTVVRYYKCSTRKRDSTKCHKTPIRKEIPEQLIADTAVKVLDNPETIDLIADRVLEAHDKQLRDTADDVENVKIGL